MGLVIGVLIFMVSAGFIVGLVIGFIVGLLPKFWRRLALLGLIVAAAVIYLMQPQGGIDRDFVYLSLATAAAGVAIGMSLALSRRDAIFERIARIRETTPVWKQVIVVGGLVGLLVVPLAKSGFQYWTLERNLSRLAGEWYGFDYSRLDGAKYRVNIDPDRGVYVRFDRDDAIGEEVEVLELKIANPNLIRMRRDWFPTDQGSAIFFLSRGDIAANDWPELIARHEFLEPVNDDSHATADLARLIRSTAQADYQKALKRLQGNRSTSGAARMNSGYEYLEDLAERIHDDGLGSFYRFVDMRNVYATFVYGSPYYSGYGLGVGICRPVYGLAYAVSEGEWTRLHDAPPNPVCGPGAEKPATGNEPANTPSEEPAGVDLTPAADFDSQIDAAIGKFVEHEYDKLLIAQLRTVLLPLIAVGDITALSGASRFPLDVMSYTQSQPHGEAFEWSENQLIDVLRTSDHEALGRVHIRRPDGKAGKWVYDMSLDVDFSIDEQRYRHLRLIVAKPDGQWKFLRAEVR